MSDVTVTTDQEDVSTEKTGVRPTVQRPPGRPGSPNGAAVTPPSVRNGQSVPRERIAVSPQRPVLQVPMSVEHPVPSNDRSPAPQRGGFAKVSLGVGTFPFRALGAVCIASGRALRAVYWAMDGDAKVRSLGLQTVGSIVATETEQHTDSEGGTSYTHHVTYEYQVEGKKYSHRKQVGNLESLGKGVPVRVYYLPGTRPLACALDGQPQALDPRTRRELEASAGRTERKGVEASNGSRPR